MIPANGQYHAYYRTTDGKPGMARAVLAWNDDGAPMVLGRNGLEDARDYQGFDRVGEVDSAVVGAVPGGGWLIDCEDDQGGKWTKMILAWKVYADGTATPITTDEDGVADDATEGLKAYRIYHPDERQGLGVESEDATETPAALESAVPAQQAGPMDRRSWYMPKKSADDLARLVDELHHDTRQPKHAVLAELVAVALEHLPDAAQRLKVAAAAEPEQA